MGCSAASLKRAGWFKVTVNFNRGLIPVTSFIVCVCVCVRAHACMHRRALQSVRLLVLFSVAGLTR